jgi:hypothetical protein
MAAVTWSRWAVNRVSFAMYETKGTRAAVLTCQPPRRPSQTVDYSRPGTAVGSAELRGQDWHSTDTSRLITLEGTLKRLFTERSTVEPRQLLRSVQ